MSEEQHESEPGTDADTGSTGDEEQAQPEPEPAESADTGESTEGDETDWKAEVDKWKALARKHEENAQKVEKDRDERVSSHENALTEAHNALASERLHTKLARAGMPEEDATALIEHLDPQRLLEDGQPSAKAIDAVAASLSRSLTRGVDEDQGQSSEAPSFSPDQWLRKKARR